jgi:hypothetical protein
MRQVFNQAKVYKAYVIINTTRPYKDLLTYRYILYCLLNNNENLVKVL